MGFENLIAISFGFIGPLLSKGRQNDEKCKKLRHYDVIATSRRHFEIKWLSFLDFLQNFLQDTFQEPFTYNENWMKYAKKRDFG